MLRYYVINLPSATDRRERVKRRLQYHHLEDKTKFVEAINKDSPILNWFEEGNTIPRLSKREEHACFLSHIKALRTFLQDSQATEAIILEDDVMFMNDFTEKLAEVLLEKDPKIPLLMLCHIVSSWENVKKISPKFFTITPKVYGTQAYWINKEYAQLCLQRLDRSLKYLPEKFITSELITRLSDGHFVMPPLVIEEAIYSNIRSDKAFTNQRNYFSHFNYDNYSAADPLDVRKLWQGGDTNL